MKRFVIWLSLLLLLIGCSDVCPVIRKRCEYIGEFRNPLNPDVTVKSCSYKCRGYGAVANFEWPLNEPCPPSFDGNFPGP